MIENSATLDEDEFVNLKEVTVQEAVQLIGEQKIYDAKTAYAVQYMQLKKRCSKNEILLCRFAYSYWENRYWKAG